MFILQPFLRDIMSNITGYYEQIHFKAGELYLYFKMTPPTGDGNNYQSCPHIDGIICSRAHELAPDKCKTERNCEILEWKDRLFHKLGIHAPTLLELDKVLREKK